MGKTIIVLVIIVIAYWYWSGAYQYSAKMSTSDDPKKNAQIIAECVKDGGGLGHDGSYTGSRESPEDICADKNNLYRGYDGWHRR
jgi:hypothetical protein